jgi:hypothetical protein
MPIPRPVGFIGDEEYKLTLSFEGIAKRLHTYVFVHIIPFYTLFNVASRQLLGEISFGVTYPLSHVILKTTRYAKLLLEYL